MDHEAYENQMIDGVNRHAEERTPFAGNFEITPVAKKSVFTKTDLVALKQGFRRTLLALLTAILFGLSVYTFIAVATSTGYLAVAFFLLAIVLLILAFICLYAQGITFVGRPGDDK